MNSVSRHLGSGTKAATLLMMRSAKKDAILVVEGDTDVDLFSNAFGISRSNILSCNGKETLMQLYFMPPRKGIDEGTIFIRDRDLDQYRTGYNNEILLLVTNRYDIEMDLLYNRIFKRILSEFLRKEISQEESILHFEKICHPASYIGALRIYSKENDNNINFDSIKYNRFIDVKDFSIDIKSMIQYMFSKSSKPLSKIETIEEQVCEIKNRYDSDSISCAKEFIDLMHLAIARHYNSCASPQCSSEVLSRMIRISTNCDDLKMIPMYSYLKDHISTSGIVWNGHPL